MIKTLNVSLSLGAIYKEMRFFEMYLREAVLKKIFANTLEMIENDVVSMPVLLGALSFSVGRKRRPEASCV